jgi:hypothetical protein
VNSIGAVLVHRDRLVGRVNCDDGACVDGQERAAGDPAFILSTLIIDKEAPGAIGGGFVLESEEAILVIVGRGLRAGAGNAFLPPV